MRRPRTTLRSDVLPSPSRGPAWRVDDLRGVRVRRVGAAISRDGRTRRSRAVRAAEFRGRRVHGLQDDVHQQSPRGGWRRLVHRLSVRGHQPDDASVRADEGSRQPRAEPRRELLGRAPDRSRVVRMPVPDWHRRGHARDILGRRSEAAAGVPAEGRLPLGGRLLGHAGVGSVVRATSARYCFRNIRSSTCPPIIRSATCCSRSTKVEQVTSINFWRRSGGDTSERGPTVPTRTSARSPTPRAASW